MKQSKDKKQWRYIMVQKAFDHGIKPAARAFKTSPQVVRKWLRRFKTQGYTGLADLSHKPHHSPKETSSDLKNHIVGLRKKYKRLGAEQIKVLEAISLAPKTIRKIWRESGVSSRKRRKKHITKNNLRAIKKQYLLFEQMVEDTKDLFDIPEYWPQMKYLKLPKVQYTFREVSCGILFLGFANQRSLTHSTLFANYINYFLKEFEVLPRYSIRQTDNGSEYIGAWNAKAPSSYTKEIESVRGQQHQTIFPGAHRMQADVETIHNLMELEFYEIENFANKKDFLNKAQSYQLFFNFQRPNSYKENKTPYTLACEKKADFDKRLLMIPVVDLDHLLKQKVYSLLETKGGKDLLTVPSIFKHGQVLTGFSGFFP